MSLAAADQFRPVTRRQPCEICGASDWCRRSASGAAECHRSTAAEVGGLRRVATTKAGFGVYREPRSGSNGRAPRRPVVVTPSEPVKTAEPLVGEPLTDAEIATHAAALGVSPESLRAIGACKVNGRFATPEYGADGNVTALVRRDPDGKKRAGRGHRRGLTIPTDFHDRDDTVFIVEGASDTAALATVGLRALGRPNNLGGAELIAELVGDADVCVIGENDAKPDGSHPGKVGAIRVATQLAERLGRPVRWALLPESYKDTREYIRANGHNCGPDLVSDLNETAETISPPADDIGPPPWADGDDGDVVDEPKRKSKAEFIAEQIAALAPEDDPRRRLPVGNPDAIADQLVDDLYKRAGQRCIQHHRGAFHRYVGAKYDPMSEDETRQVVRRFMLDNILYSVNKKGEVAKANVSRGLVLEVTAALQCATQLADLADPPFFAEPRRDDPKPTDLVIFQNGMYDAASDKFIPATPRLFTPHALAYEFDPDAKCPTWLSFLRAVSGGDAEWMQALQWWAGYMLTPDTSQQKALMLVGPPRAGKGVATRALQAMLGEDNFCAPTLTSLSSEFGLQPAIGKLGMFFSDAHLTGRSDALAIVERFKAIVGEDQIQVNVKNKPHVKTRLRTRLVIAVNELPNLPDASDALTPRLIVLPFTQSFVGREDHDLPRRIEAEAPGIAQWAIAGLRAMRASESKRLIQPAAGRATLDNLARLVSPIKAFIEDCCEVAPNAEVECSHLYERWGQWCEQNGRAAGSSDVFGQKLKAAIPTLDKYRPWATGKRPSYYRGITVLAEGAA